MPISNGKTAQGHEGGREAPAILLMQFQVYPRWQCGLSPRRLPDANTLSLDMHTPGSCHCIVAWGVRSNWAVSVQFKLFEWSRMGTSILFILCIIPYGLVLKI